jgi:hypothetical protein
MPTLRSRATIPGRLCTDQMLTFCQRISRTASTQLDVELVEFNGETNLQRLLEPYLYAVAI